MNGDNMVLLQNMKLESVLFNVLQRICIRIKVSGGDIHVLTITKQK